MPLFSVIVPVYKVEKYIKKCVDSILEQTFKDFELVLIDDGSPDNCPQICDEYEAKDSRVKVIHKDNEGVSITRQKGVNAAIGEYLVFIDADDWVSDDYLSKFAEQINKYNADIVCCGSMWVYEDKQINCPIKYDLGYYNKNQKASVIFPVLIESDTGRYFENNIWAKAIKKQIYKENQVTDIFIDIGEDSACIKPCIYHSDSIVLIGESMYYYRQNEESATKKGNAFDWNGPLNIGHHLENTIPMTEYDFQSQVYRTTVHNLFNVCVSQFNKKEKYGVIKEDILKHITNPYYQNSINKCRYRLCRVAWKNLLAKFTLKFKFIRLIYFYNKMKMCK